MFGLERIIRKWQQRRETDEFRRVEEELHKSALFSRAILDSINDHIVILDVQTFEIVDANAAFMRVMGKPFAELVGKPCYAAIHGRSEICTGPEQACPLLEMRETGQYASAEHIRYRNGIKKIAEVSASPIRDEQGTIVQVVHVAHDITARKQAEEALRESEARYRDLFENANDLIQSVRFSDGAFLYVNRAWREAMGYSEEEMAHL
ncbi:MAG TPA: PAS domain S-box protein, partial [Geobacterales bacterium]|nr:PAS domain S-box protein [Geobacterales bacterium]